MDGKDNENLTSLIVDVHDVVTLAPKLVIVLKVDNLELVPTVEQLQQKTDNAVILSAYLQNYSL